MVGWQDSDGGDVCRRVHVEDGWDWVIGCQVALSGCLLTWCDGQQIEDGREGGGACIGSSEWLGTGHGWDGRQERWRGIYSIDRVDGWMTGKTHR